MAGTTATVRCRLKTVLRRRRMYGPSHARPGPQPHVPGAVCAPILLRFFLNQKYPKKFVHPTNIKLDFRLFRDFQRVPVSVFRTRRDAR